MLGELKAFSRRFEAVVVQIYAVAILFDDYIRASVNKAAVLISAQYTLRSTLKITQGLQGGAENAVALMVVLLSCTAQIVVIRSRKQPLNELHWRLEAFETKP